MNTMFWLGIVCLTLVVFISFGIGLLVGTMKKQKKKPERKRKKKKRRYKKRAHPRPPDSLVNRLKDLKYGKYAKANMKTFAKEAGVSESVMVNALTGQKMYSTNIDKLNEWAKKELYNR